MTRRSVVQVAKDLKHAQLVARRRLPEVPGILRDRSWRAMDRVRPYSYREDDFPDSFVSCTPRVQDGPSPALPMQILRTHASLRSYVSSRSSIASRRKAMRHLQSAHATTSITRGCAKTSHASAPV